jgi:peptide methionine sulfoxide reductase msrA/msrB
MKFNQLTSEEEAVILHKQTEHPFTGEYDNFFAEGVYVCRRCNTPLYVSTAKFHSDCGWPSFDQEIPSAVKRTLMLTDFAQKSCAQHAADIWDTCLKENDVLLQMYGTASIPYL